MLIDVNRHRISVIDDCAQRAVVWVRIRTIGLRASFNSLRVKSNRVPESLGMRAPSSSSPKFLHAGFSVCSQRSVIPMSDPTSRSASASSHYRIAVSLALLVTTCAAAPATAQEAQFYAPGSWTYSAATGCPYLQTNAQFCVATGLQPNSLIPPQSIIPVYGTTNCLLSFPGAAGGTGCPGPNLPGGTIVSSGGTTNPYGSYSIEVSDNPIPTLPEWGVIGLGALLALGALRAFNRSARGRAAASP
jgi:hypothetical protein